MSVVLPLAVMEYLRNAVTNLFSGYTKTVMGSLDNNSASEAELATEAVEDSLLSISVDVVEILNTHTGTVHAVNPIQSSDCADLRIVKVWSMASSHREPCSDSKRGIKRYADFDFDNAQTGKKRLLDDMTVLQNEIRVMQPYFDSAFKTPDIASSLGETNERPDSHSNYGRPSKGLLNKATLSSNHTPTLQDSGQSYVSRNRIFSLPLDEKGPFLTPSRESVGERCTIHADALDGGGELSHFAQNQRGWPPPLVERGQPSYHDNQPRGSHRYEPPDRTKALPSCSYSHESGMHCPSQHRAFPDNPEPSQTGRSILETILMDPGSTHTLSVQTRPTTLDQV